MMKIRMIWIFIDLCSTVISDPVNFISQSVNNAASNLMEILSMDVLCDLRKALSKQELEEFDAKYGKLIEKIRDAHDKRRDEMHAESEKHQAEMAAETEKYYQDRLQRLQEINTESENRRKAKEEEHKASEEKFENLMSTVDGTIAKIGSVFDEIIDAGNRAKAELEQCASMADFYKYYDISNQEDQEDPEIGMRFANAIISKIELFGCDEYDYYENVRSHFFKLLRTYPDKHISIISKVFTSIKNSYKNSSSRENDETSQ